MNFKVILSCLMLSSCSGLAVKAQSTMIGMNENDVFSCAGVPDTMAELNDRTILEYKQDQDVQSPLDFKGPFGLSLTIGAKGTCHAVITIYDGKVSNVGYTGPNGTILGPYAACVPILKGCISK